MSDANEAAKLDREAYINSLSLDKVKAEQIPDTCEWHAISTFCVEGATWKDIIAAAINAWPGMECRPTFGPSRVTLPLSQDAGDE